MQAGLNAALDLCLKRRPGETFSHWEAQGVLLRLEVGANEAEEGTACLWAHKLHSAALQGIAEMLQTESKGQRVYGIPMESLPKVVHCLLEAIGSMDIEGLLSSPPPAPVVTHHPPPEGIEPSSYVHHAPKPSSICPKLHISRDGDGKDEELCIDHLRWLVGAGRPCHCASERHLRMDELQLAISASWIRATARSPTGWSVGCGTEAISAESSVSGSSGSSGEGQDSCAVAVVVGAIPGACNPTELKEELEAAFAPFGLLHGALFCPFVILSAREVFRVSCGYTAGLNVEGGAAGMISKPGSHDDETRVMARRRMMANRQPIDNESGA